MNPIKVSVFRRKNRKCFEAQWRDPITGTMKQKSTRERTRKAAERFAGRLEKELNEGTYKPPTSVTWSEFRERYEQEKVDSLADATAKKIWSTFHAVERLINPGRLATMTTAVVNRFQAKLRSEGLSENTIKSHLGHLRAALRWGHRQGMLIEVPHFDMPTRTGTAKHRAPTTEEIDRMVLAVPKVVAVEPRKARSRLILKILKAQAARGDQTEFHEALQNCDRQIRRIVNSWQFLLRGLYASGLRLSEALNLTWDDDRKIRVDLSRRHPTLTIPAQMQKNNKSQVCPATPEFVMMLKSIPEQERQGYVFNPLSQRPERSQRLSRVRVIRVIADIGRAANVAVNVDSRTGETEYASAHDLRRAFCYRWSRRVMPAVLKELARHASVTTTLEYYATGTAEATAAVLWEAVRNENTDTLTDNGVPDEPSPAQENAEVLNW